MRQYVWVTPWCLNLSCASTNNVYFQALGMMSATNFWLPSMMFLYSSPFICVNKSASCCGALPFENCLDMHLQNRSIFCIWSRASCLFAVRSFGVISWVVSAVVRSCVTVSLMCWIFEGLVSMFTLCWCNVLLLVLNAAPSKFVAVSSFMMALPSVCNLTNLERQLVTLFHAPDINSNVIL